MTTTDDTIKITLSERRPIKIAPGEWRVVALADWHDGAVACQANHERRIAVREHADGRHLVYGWLRAGNGGVHASWRGAEGGYLVDADDEDGLIRAIRRVAGIIGDPGLGDACIADLPASEAVR